MSSVDANNDEPFACFGSDDDDDNSDRSHDNNEKAVRLVHETNLRRSVADEMIDSLPMDGNGDYEVYKTEDSGMGVRALRKFSIGEEILREGAVMRVPNRQAASTAEEAQDLHQDAIQRAFARLSSPTQKAVLDLSNSYDSETNSLLGIYQTNSYQLWGNGDAGYDEIYGGLFLTVARINHSCRPNAQHYWRRDLQRTLVHAVQDIGIGDEICTIYGPSDCLRTDGRRSYLEERFSFVCGCGMCTEGNQRGGDDRMLELSRRQEEIQDLLAQAADSLAGSNSVEREANEILGLVDHCMGLLADQKMGVASGALKSILQFGYQAALLLPTEGEAKGDHIAFSFLSKLLVATEVGEGAGSPNAFQIRQMIEKLNSN